MKVQAIDPGKRRWSFGKLSVQIAVWIFVVTWVMFIAVTIFIHNMPKKSFLADAVSSVFVAELFAAPFAHLAGLVLGVIALFRAGDRRGLAVVGIILNVIVVAIGVTMVYMAASGLAPR
jgi:hypothetical protein